MDPRIKELVRGLNKIRDAGILSDNAFCVIYGSYPDGVAKATSDMDLFVVNKEYGQSLLGELKRVVVDIHGKFNIPFDLEVSFENKLLMTFKEVEKASRLNGMNMKDGRFVVPELLKTKSYLESEQIKFRLVFNALSSPHYVLWRNNYYQVLRERVTESLFWLAVDLLDTDRCTLDEIHEILLASEDSRQGEGYLGYKLFPRVVQTIKKNILNEAIRLSNDGQISYAPDTGDVQIVDFSRLEALKNEFVGSNSIHGRLNSTSLRKQYSLTKKLL